MSATAARNDSKTAQADRRMTSDGTPRLASRPGRRRSPETVPGRRKPVKAKGIDLRPSYRITFMGSLSGALLLMIGLFRMPMAGGGDETEFTLVQQEVVQMEEIQQTEQVKRPPPPPRPPVPVEVPDDRILEDVELDLDVSLDMDAVVELPPPPPPAAPVEEEVMEEEIFVVVEQMPVIIGGTQKVYEYLEYPEIARQAGVEGLAVIQLVVGTDGVPTDFSVARSAGEVLDVAAMNAVSKLRFEPGKQRGKAVRVRMAIPIRFRLKTATARGT